MLQLLVTLQQRLMLVWIQSNGMKKHRMMGQRNNGMKVVLLFPRQLWNLVTSSGGGNNLDDGAAPMAMEEDLEESVNPRDEEEQWGEEERSSKEMSINR